MIGGHDLRLIAALGLDAVVLAQVGCPVASADDDPLVRQLWTTTRPGGTFFGTPDRYRICTLAAYSLGDSGLR